MTYRIQVYLLQKGNRIRKDDGMYATTLIKVVADNIIEAKEKIPAGFEFMRFWGDSIDDKRYDVVLTRERLQVYK